MNKISDKVFARAVKDMDKAGRQRALDLLAYSGDINPDDVEFSFGEWAGESEKEIVDQVSPAGLTYDDIDTDDMDELLEHYQGGFYSTLYAKKKPSKPKKKSARPYKAGGLGGMRG
jgi:hypothetical protein